MRILYLFPHRMGDEADRVFSGQAPSETLYGMVELRQLGHTVELSDSRWEGWFGKGCTWLRRYDVGLVDLKTILEMRRYDLVVVKDSLSLLATWAARIMGTKVVYLDALFGLPEPWWKRLAYRLNFRSGAPVVMYSKTQVTAWRDYFALSPRAPKFLPYTIDLPFYRPSTDSGSGPGNYVLAIGRDNGRDFPTLVEAMAGTGLKLKLITLPHTLHGIDRSLPYLEILEHLTYDELFRLYAGAMFVAIPLRKWVTNPSGIRALLEALAMGKAVVCTGTSVLREYVQEGQGVTFVEPENVPAMREAIRSLAARETWRRELGRAGQEVVLRSYGMAAFAVGFEEYLREIAGDGRKR